MLPTNANETMKASGLNMDFMTPFLFLHSTPRRTRWVIAPEFDAGSLNSP